MKICPECKIDVDIPGKSNIQFCPFCGTSLKSGKQVRYERFAFFLTPVFIFALTSILFKFVLKLNNSIEISSIISGKLAVCFFIGSFVYTLIIRLFKIKSAAESYRKAGMLSIALFFLSFYLCHDINVTQMNELANNIAPDSYLEQKRLLWLKLLIPSILFSAIAIVFQNRALIKISMKEEYSKFFANLTLIITIIAFISFSGRFFSHTFEERMVITSEIMYSSGSTDKAIDIINVGENKQNKSEINQNKLFSFYKGKYLTLLENKEINRDEAVKYLEKSLNDFPSSVMVKHYLSIAYQKAGKKIEALKYAEEAFNIVKSSTVLSSRLGNLFVSSEMPERAIDAYKITLQNSKNSNQDPLIMNNLSYLILENDGDKLQALELAKQAYEKSPTNVSCIDTLAWAFYKNGRKNEALETIKQIETFADEIPEIKFHYIMILDSIGLLRDTAKQLDKLLSLPEIVINKPLTKSILEARAGVPDAKEAVKTE